MSDGSGAWADSNANGRVDTGETVIINMTVTNIGTVTLQDITVTDTFHSVGCTTRGSFSLKQSEDHGCVAIRQVGNHTSSDRKFLTPDTPLNSARLSAFAMRKQIWCMPR